ncbi:MAG TPA: hypothetical protein P5210_12215 [Draconibacterium sp.]|nr:hypothetical protein [Draconibacterium sp.]HRX12412.1 hypothetical protein [Draconibacterium sp.]
MKPKTYVKPVVLCIVLFFFSLNIYAQTSVSLKSQWLDPTNLFTEKVPTAEFNTTFSVGGNWSLNFYYAHDVEHLSPIYLIGGVNNTRESSKKDSLVFAKSPARTFSKYSRNIFVSYQYSQTIRQLSWVQPIVTWDWNFIKNPSHSVHTLTAEISGWMSIQRENEYQDGGYINGKYNYARHFEKWLLNSNLSTIAIVVLEEERDVFVLGEILTLSATYLPFNTTLEVVLNKPLITKDDDDLGFTVGLIKEF